MFSLKIVIAVVGLMIVFFLYVLWDFGRNLAQNQRWSPKGVSILGAKEGALMIFSFLNAVEIALILWLVYINPNPHAVPWMLQVVHRSLDAIAVILFVAILWKFNGTKRPDVHKYFTYAFIVVYLGAAVTGFIQLYLVPT